MRRYFWSVPFLEKPYAQRNVWLDVAAGADCETGDVLWSPRFEVDDRCQRIIKEYRGRFKICEL